MEYSIYVGILELAEIGNKRKKKSITKKDIEKVFPNFDEWDIDYWLMVLETLKEKYNISIPCYGCRTLEYEQKHMCYK